MTTTTFRDLGEQEVPGGEDLTYPVPRFSLAERDRRWAAVRKEMERAGADVLVGLPNTGHTDHWQSDIRYLTQIGGNNIDAAVVFPLEREPTAFATNELYWGVAAPFWLRDLRPSVWRWGDVVGQRLQELAAETGREDLTIAITGLKGVLRAPEGTTPWGTVERLREMMPRAKLVNGTDICRLPRYIKSQEEIEFLRGSVGLIEKAIDAMYRTARPGVKESQVYAAMIAAMLADGGEVPTMLSWISGPWGRLSRRMTIATQRVMQKGDAIVNEVEARYGGYTGQQEQPLFLGPLPQDAQDLFQVQSEALHAALSTIRPGQTFQAVIDAVDRVTQNSTKYKARLIMHGRGLGDDWPLIVDSEAAGGSGRIQDQMIQANTVFTVKPNAAPREATYRGERINWSDTVVVTETGVERLGTRTPGLLSVDC